VEVWKKNIAYWFIKGQTHPGMPRGARMAWILNELLVIQIQTLVSEHAPQMEINY